jgi:pimeloyl-ACP methyl ester carboxylesterase
MMNFIQLPSAAIARFIACVACTITFLFSAVAAPMACAPDAASPIHEHRFVPIGGIEQWVTIDGSDCANPVILFVHGGPGNPLSAFADAVYGAWAKHFTLVQWDQRGAGMTFGRNKPLPGVKLTVEQMAGDGIEVANFLRRSLGKQKIILTGSSWGSVLAVHMVKAHPELFSAYVGVSQIVGKRINEDATYAALLSLSRQAGDAASLASLRALGAPPWTNPRNFGLQRRIIRKYEALAATPAPASWWVIPAEYDNAQYRADYDEGEDYSYLQDIGLQGDGMFAQVDLRQLGTAFSLPVFLIQGEADLLTMPAITRRYFDAMTAPEKAFVVVPHAGHDPNEAMIDAQYKILMERVRPLSQ